MNSEMFYSNNRAAEMQLLSYMFSHDEYVEVPEDYFYNKDTLTVYRFVKKQFQAGHDINITMIEQKHYAMVAEIIEMNSTRKPDGMIAELKKHYSIRTLNVSVVKAVKAITVDEDAVVEQLGRLSHKITNLLTDNEDKPYCHAESVGKYMAQIEEMANNKSAYRGYTSHLPDLDRIISGWERGRVYLVSGYEKLGKSRFVRHLLSHWLNNNLGCLVFMLEEDAESIHECIIANRATINTDNMGTSRLTTDNLVSISKEVSKYYDQPLSICTKSSVTPEFVRGMVQKQKIQFKAMGRELIFVVVDYIQRLRGEGNSKHEETEVIASRMADICREENVCMIQISQLTAAAERSKGVALHSLIRYGKPFKEAASTIITFDDPDRNKEAGDKDVTIPDYKIIKAHIIQRRGLSNITLDLRAQLQYSSFHNLQK